MNDHRYKELRRIIQATPCGNDVRKAFIERNKRGLPTRDEDPESHFCVYFAAYDRRAGHVFLGHHKKSGLWLFNGGHIDKGESPLETVEREVLEEWGYCPETLREVTEPSLLTITDIENPAKQICKHHFDIWYFVPVKAADFAPVTSNLNREFYEARWLTVDQAQKLNTDRNTLYALDVFRRMFQAK